MPEAARSRGWIALLVVEGFSSFCGFLGGVALLADPSGGLLGVPLRSFEGLPIDDFLLPGLWLFTVYGIGFALATHLLRAGRPQGLASRVRPRRDLADLDQPRGLPLGTESVCRRLVHSASDRPAPLAPAGDAATRVGSRGALAQGLGPRDGRREFDASPSNDGEGRGRFAYL
jgi:hypothetical protein